MSDIISSECTNADQAITSVTEGEVGAVKHV